MEVFLNGELQDEVYTRQMENEVSFSTKSSREDIMQEIDRRRRTELYPHPPEDCYEFCQKEVLNLVIIYAFTFDCLGTNEVS